MTQKIHKPLISFAVVAVDVVIFAIQEKSLKVMLIKPKDSPFPSKWVLPGGLVQPKESIEFAVERHLLNKTGTKDLYLEQLYTFGAIDRDPRGRVVAVGYLALTTFDSFELKTSEAYEDIKWFDLYKVPQLGYDHNDIITKAYSRLKSKLEYTNIAYNLLPKEFTLTELQDAYETILNKKIDKRNFRKKLNLYKIVKPTKNTQTGLAHRPAQLYTFTSHKPQIIL